MTSKTTTRIRPPMASHSLDLPAICDVCGKVEPLDHYGIPVKWIYLEKRDKPPASSLTGNDDEDFPRSEFERVCCSWACVEELARRKQAEAD